MSIVAYLLENGADVKTWVSVGSIGCDGVQLSTAVTIALLQRGSPALVAAAEGGHIAVVEHLVAHGADVNETDLVSIAACIANLLPSDL